MSSFSSVCDSERNLTNRQIIRKFAIAMKIEKFSSNQTTDYSVAVNTIKEAILRSQYQAAKLVNREMPSLYYGI